jgi:tyrosine-protein kinase
MDSKASRSAGELRTYLGVLSRRKWIILPLVVLTPIVAYYVASTGTKKYSASAQVLLNRQNQSLSSVPDPTLYDPQRLVSTQARVARAPAIARLVLQKAGLRDRGPNNFLGESSISADQTTDVLTFNVTDRNPALATKLANLYALSYKIYRQQTDTAALGKAASALEKQLTQLRKAGQSNTQAYANLFQQLDQLRTAQVLTTSNVQVLRTATSAGQVEPRPTRFAMIGLALGLVLGVGAAFLVDALDTRIRSTDEIADSTGLPLLGRLPPPSATGRRRHRLAMLDRPVSAEAEPFRILRTNLQFANLEHGCRSIMITSALHSEGKSTTAGNLAVALARAGSSVLLVDLDLRRPSLHRFFDLGDRPGVTEVLLGYATIDEAVSRLTFAAASDNGSVGRLGGRPRPSQHRPAAGTLEVMGAGSIPPNPGEFITTTALDSTLEQMMARADLLLVDGPPMLLAGDALTLSAKVDGIIVVARLNSFDREAVDELGRFLKACPSEKLGLVVTDDGWNRGYGYYYSQQLAETRKKARRARA